MIDKKLSLMRNSCFWLCSLMLVTLLNSQSAYADPHSSESDRSQNVSEPKNTKPKTRFHTAIPQAFRWTGEGAWQPPQGEWYLGLSESYWAPFSWLSLHTWPTPWLIGAANLGLRMPLWTSQYWSLGLSAHLMYLDLAKINQENTTSSQALRISPTSLYASYQLNPRWLLGTELRSTIISGSTRDNQEQSFNGVAATSNSHLRFQLAYALGEKWSLWWIWSRLNQQSTTLNAYSNISLQNGGSLEVYGILDSDIIDYKGASAHTFKLLYRGNVFTGMIGVAFGSPSVYYLGTVVKTIKFLPYLELGWRF